jgi:hypothetical protein
MISAMGYGIQGQGHRRALGYLLGRPNQGRKCTYCNGQNKGAAVKFSISHD